MGDVRLIDHLCPDHAEAGLHRWPVAGDFGVLLDDCDSCRRIANDLHPSGNYTIRVLPDLDPRTYEHGDAVHESAHAVLGLLADMPLDYVLIEPRLATTQAGPRSHTKWHDYSTPMEKWAAMCWAGQRAHLRWLAVEGLDTRANRVDAVNMGCHDTKLVLDAAAERGLPDDIGWDLAGELLDAHWTAVMRVADALANDRRLSGDEIARIAGLEVCA